MHSNNITHITIIIGLILLVPLIAMQFTDEVNWNLVDFIVAGVFLFGTGLALELTVKKITSPVYRFIIGIAIAVALLLIWAELGVGIF